MNWTVIIELFKLVPTLIAAIRAIEEAIPAGGLGVEKLSAIKAIMSAASDNVEKYWPIIEKTIGVLVSLFNKTGVFAK